MERYEKVNKDIHRREIQVDTSHEVVMANKMILHSACNLSLNELKLLRYVIMQTRKGDEYLFEYDFAVKDFAKDAEISVKDAYRDFRKMTRHMMQEVLEIEVASDDWRMFHWVDICHYHKGIVTIKISDELRPYLLNLAGNFTKYELDEIIRMKSAYAIRIYEVIRSHMDDRKLPHADYISEISISMEVLRKITNTESKFKLNTDFKRKVIDISVNEINRCSKYHVTAIPYKRSRAIAGYDFVIESRVGYEYRQQFDNKIQIIDDQTKEQTIDDQIEGQMNISDYGITGG